MTIPGLDHLTPREKEILQLIGEGKSLLDIAQQLHRSLKTIESHRLSLGKKLNASNRVELAKIAIAHGLISVPAPEDAPTTRTASQHSRAIQSDPIASRWATEITHRIYDRAGAEYLNELCKALCSTIGVEHAGVCVVEKNTDGEEILRALAYSERGEIRDQFNYQIYNSPCATVIEAGKHLASDNITSLYPHDKELPKLNAESYAGVCLCDRKGVAIGVLWLIGEAALEDINPVHRLLDYLAPRVEPVVVEIQRHREALSLCEEQCKELDVANQQLQTHNEQLDQIANYYSSLAERMSDGLVVLDRNWRIKYCNKKFAEIVGAKRSELAGQRADMILTPESRELFQAMQDARMTDRMDHYQAQLRRPDGEIRDIYVAPRTLFDDQGHFAGSFAVVTDVTELLQEKRFS